MTRGAKRVAVKVILALLGVLTGWVAASYAFGYFIANGVTSDYATGYSIIVFLAVLGAFGLIAFKVNFTRLRPSYAVLAFLAFFLSLVSLNLATGYGIEWLSAFISNTATGIVSSLIIILVIDDIIERNKEKERTAVIKVAIRRLRLPIIHHVTLLVKMYKVAAQNRPSVLLTTYEDVFAAEYYREISFLDFSKDAPVVPKTDWFRHMHSELSWFREKLEQILDTYSAYLHSELIDLLERIAHSSFLEAVTQAYTLPSAYRQFGINQILSGTEKLVQEYVILMLQLIEYYNHHSDSRIEFDQAEWSDRVAPNWGSSRI